MCYSMYVMKNTTITQLTFIVNFCLEESEPRTWSQASDLVVSLRNKLEANKVMNLDELALLGEFIECYSELMTEEE